MSKLTLPGVALAVALGIAEPLPLTSTAIASECALCAAESGVRMKAQTDTKLRVLLNVVSEQIAASVPFKAIVSICPSDDPKLERVRFDATMPAHGHGMNYDVELRKTAIGCYKTGPLLFHMPGLWRIELAVRTSSQTVRFFHEVTVE